MAIISNLVIDQGATFTADIDVTDADGDALNLAGYTTAGQMRKTYASTTATDFAASILSESNGTVRITLSAAQTNAAWAQKKPVKTVINSPKQECNRLCRLHVGCEVRVEGLE